MAESSLWFKAEIRADMCSTSWLQTTRWKHINNRDTPPPQAPFKRYQLNFIPGHVPLQPWCSALSAEPWGRSSSPAREEPKHIKQSDKTFYTHGCDHIGWHLITDERLQTLKQTCLTLTDEDERLMRVTWEIPDSNSSGFSPFGLTILALVLNMALCLQREQDGLAQWSNSLTKRNRSTMTLIPSQHAGLAQS